MTFDPTTHSANLWPVHYGGGIEDIKYRVQIIEESSKKVVFERIFTEEGPAIQYVENHRKGNG